MTSARQRLGHWGETQARLRLEAQGYRILATNYRCRLGEVDIIAQDGDETVFVEVKTRRGANYGTPEESITPAKGQRLAAIAYSYVESEIAGEAEVPWRIDLVSVSLDKRGKLLGISHLKHAVEG